MHLLHVTHQYRPAIGGSEKYFTDLSEELVRRGHQVDVFTARSRDFWTWRNELPGFEQLAGVNVYRFRSLRRRGYTWRLLEYGQVNYQRTRSPLYEPFILFGSGPLSAGIFLNILFRGHHYDLVHLNTLPYAHVVYSYLAARWQGLPVVITPHLHVDQHEVFDIGSFNKVLRGADLVLADSELEKDYLLSKRVVEERIVVCGTGLRLEESPTWPQEECRRRLGLPAEAFVLLFLGRKVAYKGLETVLQAFLSLRQRYPHLHLVAAGPETDYSRQLFAFCAGLPGLHCFDLVSDEKKNALLNACDVLLLPSVAEAFGIVFLEAWAVGKPVIGARSGAIPFIVDEEQDGLLVEPGDTVGLIRQVERLMADPELRGRLGSNGYEKVWSRYTVARIADIVEGAYIRLLRQRRNQRRKP
jgi:glycosyltransferase involved in cell wall biosynthesis